MFSSCCERCEASGAVLVAKRAWLCTSCIRRALDARFPVLGLPLVELVAALERAEPTRASGS